MKTTKALLSAMLLAVLCISVQRASAQYYILPKAANATTAWSYLAASLDDGITAGYEKTTFDDSSWKTGQSGFGITSYKKDWVNTTYAGAQGLWIRKTVSFDVQDVSSLKFELCYDEDPVIYVNGTKVYETTGWNDNSYKDITSAIDKSAFNLQGDNVIAIHFAPGGGGSCLDFSIYCSEEVEDLNVAYTSLIKTPTARQDGDLGSNSWIDGTERTAVAGWETTQEKLDAMTEAYNAWKADETAATKAALKAALADVKSMWSPLTDGIYFMIPRYGDDQGGNNTQALTYTDNAAWKKPLITSDPSFMFEVKIKSYQTVDGHADTPETMTIKNLGNGKYLGAISGSAWQYTDEEVVWSYNTFVGSDFYSDTKHAHCFGLNIGGKYMTYVKNTAGCAITTTTGGYAWMKSWMFRPADSYYQDYLDKKELYNIINDAAASLSTVTPANHHDNGGTRSFLLGNEKLNSDGIATSKAAIDALQAAIDAITEAVDNGKTAAELTDEIAAMDAAKAAVDAKTNPLVDGYYYIVAEFGDDTNNIPGGFVLTYGALEDSKAVSKAAYNAADKKQMFKATYDAANGKVKLQNVASGLYLGKTSGNKWYFTSEETTLNIASGADAYWYHTPPTSDAARSCAFFLTDGSGKGLNTTIATGSQTTTISTTYAWQKAWAFRPVAEEVTVETPAILNINDGVATANTNEPFTLAQLQQAVGDDDYEAPGSIDLTGITLASGVTATDLTALLSGNQVAYVADGSGINGTNIVRDGECANLVLADKTNFAPADAFKANAATITRKLYAGLNTVCVPMAIAASNIPVADAKLYTFAGVNGGTIEFAETAAVEAGVPCIVELPAGTTTTEYDLTFNAADVTIAPANTTQIIGTYTNQNLGEGYYKLSEEDIFVKTTATSTIKAFRFYLDVAGASSNSFALNLGGDDDLTGITSSEANLDTEAVAIYSEDGIKRTTLQKGINIIRLASGEVQKVIIK